MAMNGLRDSTIQWYLEWLQSTRPELSEEQRFEMAVGFTDAQCSAPKVEEDVTDEDIKDLVGATERANARREERAEVKLQEMLKALANDAPLAKIEVRRDRPNRRLRDYKGE